MAKVKSRVVCSEKSDQPRNQENPLDLGNSVNLESQGQDLEH